jgi:AraC-like DNA-binding protein
MRPSREAEFGSVLAAFDELLCEEDVDTILRRAVELARSKIGLKRAALFLLDEQRNLMLGSWGTDLDGNTVDEHHVMYQLGASDRNAFRRAEEEGAHFTIFDDCPIVIQCESETQVVGKGWVAATPIRGVRGNLGMLFNDEGLDGTPVENRKQDRAALLCSFLGVLLDQAPRSRQTPNLLTTPAHPIVAGTLRLLAKDPSLVGKELAAELGLSVSRLARVFKEQMGMSLVEYRNRLRLERFDVLLDEGGENLLEAALAAGFGSYSQFHRVFRALRGMTPKQYLQATRANKQSAPSSVG